MVSKYLKKKPEQTFKWPKILIAILSTIGIIDTGSITLKNWGIFQSLSCPGTNNGYETDLNSPWGSLIKSSSFDIPLSLVGFITYSSLLVISILLTLKIVSPKHETSRILWWLIFLISCGSSTFSILLINIMFFKIQAFCFFCILSAVLSFSIFILSIIGGKFESREPMFYRGMIVSLTILISGLIWSNQVDPAKASNNSINENQAPLITTKSNSQKIEFARFLSKNNIVMYSAYWCPHCHDQKQLFGKLAVEQLNIVECAKDGVNNNYELCQKKEIDGFPSWEIKNEIYSGVRDLKELAEIAEYKGDTNF